MNIVVGITGGIAAYKAVAVVRALVLAGHDVHVVATDAALRFVGRPTLEAISRNPVHTDLYEGVAEVRHVAIGQRADLIVIAPATAHTSPSSRPASPTTCSATRSSRRRRRWCSRRRCTPRCGSIPATVANVATLVERGVHHRRARRAGSSPAPTRARAAWRSPTRSWRAALAVVGPRDLAGRRILITAGGTREPLDPVRFIGNRSSGKQGVALAAGRGAPAAPR